MARGRRRTKGFEFAEGVYYFIIKSRPNNITLHRKSKGAAVDTFRRYAGIGKEVEWLGKWEDGAFTDTGVS